MKLGERSRVHEPERTGETDRRIDETDEESSSRLNFEAAAELRDKLVEMNEKR